MTKMKKINSLLIISIIQFLVSSFLLVAPAYSAVKIKLLAVNPSQDSNRKITVEYAFPSEIKKEDVLDPGGMDIDYDVQKGVYYVTKQIELAPKATRIFQVVIQDKWNVQQEEIDSLKNKLTERLKVMEGTDQYETAKLLADNINTKLDSIIKAQNEAAADIERKMGLTRANLKLMKQLENDIMSLDYFVAKSANLDQMRSIRYFVEASNPKSNPIETTVTEYLPKGVGPEHIVSSSGFDIHYDNNLGLYYLSKSEKLEAGQAKRYEIEVKDMWSVADPLLDSYTEEAEGYLTLLKDTKYKDVSGLVFEEIAKFIEDIKASQKGVSGLKERMSLYKTNSEKEAKIREDIERLKSLLAEVVRKQAFHTVLKVKDPLAQLRIADVKKKKEIPKVEIWQVILYLVIFLIIFTIAAVVFWINKDSSSEKNRYNKIEKQKPAPPPQ